MAMQEIKSIKRSNVPLILSLVVMAIIFIVIFVDFFISLNKKLDVSSNENLTSVSQINANNAKNGLSSLYYTFNGMSNIVAGYDDLCDTKVENALKKASEKSIAIAFYVTDDTGKGLVDGTIKDVSFWTGYSEAIRGKNYICYSSGGQADIPNTVTVWVPIKKNEEIVGTFRAIFDMKAMDNLFRMSFSDANYDTFIITKQGKYIGSNFEGDYDKKVSRYNNYAQALGLGSITGPLFENIDSNTITFSLGDKTDKAVYQVLEDENEFYPEWYVFTVLSSDFLTGVLGTAQYIGILTTIKMIAAILIMMFLTIWFFRSKLMRSDDIAEILVNNLEKHEDLLKRTGMIMFNWNLETDQIEYSDAWNDYFRYKKPTCSSEIAEGNMVYKEDMSKAKGFISRLIENSDCGDISIRLISDQSSTDSVIWFKVLALVEKNHNDVPVSISGFLMSVDFEKGETLKVKKNAEYDALTKILNRNAAYNRIVNYLSGDGKGKTSMFMVIDVDNFKYVNDEYGHLEGDECLIEIADMLQKNFKMTDVVGRFGGDEFIVFMKDCEDIDDYEKKVNEFMDKMILPEQEGRDRITTSIGYAVYPTEGKSYERLFQKADERMYAIKKPKFKKVSSKAKNEPDPYDDDL